MRRAVESSYPWWMWPTLLSVEAPVIAVVWSRLLSQSLGGERPVAIEAALGIAVWLIYLLDRLLDSMTVPLAHVPLHDFYGHNRREVCLAIGAGALALGYLLTGQAGATAVWQELPVLAGVGAYLAVVHLPALRVWKRWPRELAVAGLFAAGICVPVLRSRGMVLAYLLLASLLSLNCSGVKVWAADGPPRSAVTLWLGRHLPVLGAALALFAWTVRDAGETVPVSMAVAISAVLLAALPAWGGRWRHEVWSLAADAALCSPLLLPAFWR